MKNLFAVIGVVAIIGLVVYWGYGKYQAKLQEQFEAGVRAGAGVGPEEDLPLRPQSETEEAVDDMRRITELNLFLDRCAAIQPQFIKLRGVLQKADEQSRFGEERFRQGEAYGLVKYWYDHKYYSLPFTLETIASMRSDVNKIATAVNSGIASKEQLQSLFEKHLEVGNRWLGIPFDQNTGYFRRDLVATHPKAPEVLVDKFKAIADVAVPGWPAQNAAPEKGKKRGDPPPPMPGISYPGKVAFRPR